MTLPNFLIVGAARCGTSSMHRYLHQHPQVFTTDLKEVNYFLEKPKDGFISTLDEYRKYFIGASDKIAIGESSVSYMFFEHVAKDIRCTLGDIKIIISIRQPVDRAYSHYYYRRYRNMEPINNFLTAFHSEDQIIQERNNPYLWSYKSASFYYRQIKPYFDHFSHENIKIIIFDDFLGRPQQVIQSLYHFLDVDSHFTPDVSRAYATSRLPHQPRTFLRLRAHTLLRFLIGQMDHAPQIHNRPISPLPQSIHAELTQLYREDILATQSLINRDLSMWLEEA